MLIAIVLDKPLAEAKALVDDPAAFTREMTRIVCEKQSHPLIAQRLPTLGVPAIHQRSKYLAKTGFPVPGRSVLLFVRCAPCTVLKAGTHMWERVCDQPRRQTGQLRRTGDSEQGSIYVELLGLFDFLEAISVQPTKIRLSNQYETVSCPLYFVRLWILVLIGDCKGREFPRRRRIQ